MLARATTRPIHSLRRATKGFHRIAAAGVAIAGALGAGQYAKAADKNIYPDNHATTPWSFQDVNDYIDPVKCAANKGGPRGESCPIDGDKIIFNGHEDGSVGTYKPPVGPPTESYRFKTNNVEYICNNAEFTGNQAESPALIRTYSGNNTISGCVLDASPSQNAQGIVSHSGFSPANPMIIEGNSFFGFDKGCGMDNLTNPEENTQPGYIIRNNYFKRNQIAANFAKATGITASAVGASTIFSVFEENTVEETGAIGFVPVTYPNSGVAGTSWVARGIDRFTGNIFINSANGIPLAPEAYGATAIGSASSVTAAGTGDPNNNIEFQIATDVDSCPQDPAPGSNCYQGSFEIWYGEGNIVEDPKFNWARRPTYGVQPPTTQSPAIIRKAGAFPPVYDTGSRTGDWKVTRLGDFTGPRGFRKAFADSHNETLTSNLQSIHDIDGNGFVELYDFSNSKEGGFLQACINCGGDFDNNGKNDLEDILVGDLNNDNLDKNDNGILDGFEGIPATTTWTLLSMALLTAISGTVILRNKKVRTILE